MLSTTQQWWASITVNEKERIASKIAKKEVKYPDCTDVWNALSEEKQIAVFEHCKGKHGAKIVEWFDGEAYTD